MRRAVSLFRRIERALETIAHGHSPLETIQQTAHFLADNFSADLGIRGGRIYERDNGSYELVTTFGEVAKAPIGLRVWRSYPPIEHLLDVGALVMRRDDPMLDQRLEDDLGTREWFASIAVAQSQFLLTFDVDAFGVDHEELIATLNIIRLAINQKLREERVLAIIEEARQIQASILPQHLPRPGDFELAARSVAAEIVGGDFYDVITLDDDTFDVVIADATGHGLPAALQVRDIFTGLRMGLSREFKVTRTIERLNQIIHRSRLATKFVSLFLAEINIAGLVTYCNAGHPAAILMQRDGEVRRLVTGGMILGPLATSTYTIGVAEMQPGDIMVLFTDGITEARKIDTELEYGEDCLISVIRRNRHNDAAVILERIFDDVSEFSCVNPPEDDQTVVVVKRRSGEIEEEPA